METHAVTRPNFIAGKAATVRLSSVAATALGLQGAQEVQLDGFTILDGGWLQADYRNGDGSLDRYLLPLGSVLYVKQPQTAEETGAGRPEPTQVVRPATPPAQVPDTDG